MLSKVIERVKIFEGYSEKPYLCPSGKWTIGWGYNYEDRGLPKAILRELLIKVYGLAEVEQRIQRTYRTVDLTFLLNEALTVELAQCLLTDDVQMVLEQCCDNFSWFYNLDEVRQATVLDMCYQLGISRLLSFRRMIAAFANYDYKTAALEAKNSLWFEQSGRRARINVKQIATGMWGAL